MHRHLRTAAVTAAAAVTLAACESDVDKLERLRTDRAIASLSEFSHRIEAERIAEELGFPKERGVLGIDTIPGQGGVTFDDCPRTPGPEDPGACTMYREYLEAGAARRDARNRVDIVDRDIGRLLR